MKLKIIYIRQDSRPVNQKSGPKKKLQFLLFAIFIKWNLFAIFIKLNFCNYTIETSKYFLQGSAKPLKKKLIGTWNMYIIFWKMSWNWFHEKTLQKIMKIFMKSRSQKISWNWFHKKNLKNNENIPEFDFRSFLVWTFLNFLARCDATLWPESVSDKM